MEDFLKFLLIAGVILVGIFKEVNKNSKSKKTRETHPVPPKPSPSTVEIDPDAVPIPEIWSKHKPLGDLLEPFFEPVAPKPAPKKPKKKEEISISASLANSVAQDERNAKQGSHFASSDSSENEEDFAIRSAEEARRAIIWGEILQRKY